MSSHLVSRITIGPSSLATRLDAALEMPARIQGYRRTVDRSMELPQDVVERAGSGKKIKYPSGNEQVETSDQDDDVKIEVLEDGRDRLEEGVHVHDECRGPRHDLQKLGSRSEKPVRRVKSKMQK